MGVSGGRPTITLRATGFSRSEVAQQAARQRLSLGRMLAAAALYFVSDLGRGRPAARLPRFKLGQEDGGSLKVTLEMERNTGEAIDGCARRERVPVERVLEHA